MASTRLQAVDVYRGLALVCMAAYHAIWDLNYYRLIEVGVGVDPLWLTVQRSILTAFLLLAGGSLALAHGNGINWRSFWRREAILVAAAAAVSLGTWLLLGDYLAYFGVLHAIALFSLIALPFVRAPIWAGIAGAAIILAASLWTSNAFDPRWLDWIGFFRIEPETADLVPVFPWLGVFLIGVVGMRILRATPAFTWSTTHRGARAFALLGRWSLIFYLIHQPILFGIIAPLAGYVSNSEQARLEGYLRTCQANCTASADNALGFCTAYCGCALDMTVRDNLWDAPTDRLKPMQTLCTAMSK